MTLSMNCLIYIHIENLQPVLEAISAPIEFKYPKAPVLARLAIGKTWNEVTLVVIHLILFYFDKHPFFFKCNKCCIVLIMWLRRLVA